MSDLLNSASLVMIPSGYAEDKVYSAVPTDGSGDLSFTRSSNGTRINSAGLVEVTPWNLAQYSEDFQTGWTLANVTVTANDITAPNGTLTADKFTISVNGNDVKQTISVLPNTVYTWSFYVYGGTALGQQMRFYDNTNSTNIEYYNYSSSVVLGAWVKIERTFTTPSGCYEIQAWVLAATSTIGTMWAWGAQLNIGSTAKPYFPTTDRLNVPRLTYQNGGGGCPSLLLEKQSTNHILYSEDYSQTAWTKTGTAITTNQITSPDGTQNADLMTTNDAAGSVYRMYEANSAGSNAVCTTSVYFKYGNWQYVFIVCDNYVSAPKWAVFDLINITNTFVSSGYTATITSVGNGWYKCTLTGEMKSTTYNQFGLAPTSTDYSNISIANGKTLYIWGTQREQSSYPTSYISTTSASATRVADACSKTGISSLIGQTSGVIFVDINRTQKSENYNIPIFVGSGNNIIQLYFRSTNDLVGQVYTSAGQQAAIVSSALANGRYKIALAYASNDFAMYINGTQIGTDSSGNVPTCSQVIIGDDGTGLAQFNDSINQAILFPTRLTNAELASLTTI